MRLLITADLHFRLHWFRWLIEQAPDLDLVCIAGDLLDIRGKKNHSGSVEVLRFADKPGCRGSFFITFRPRMARMSAVRNWKPRNLTYRPDYFVSGHDHSFPYTFGQSWNQKLGEVRLLVPGSEPRQEEGQPLQPKVEALDDPRCDTPDPCWHRPARWITPALLS